MCSSIEAICSNCMRARANLACQHRKDCHSERSDSAVRNLFFSRCSRGCAVVPPSGRPVQKICHPVPGTAGLRISTDEALKTPGSTQGFATGFASPRTTRNPTYSGAGVQFAFASAGQSALPPITFPWPSRVNTHSATLPPRS
jgi:hypothetical protein